MVNRKKATVSKTKKIAKPKTLQCSSCKKTKIIDEFNRNKAAVHREGRAQWCKDCTSEYAKTHYKKTHQKKEVVVKRKTSVAKLFCSKCKGYKLDAEFHVCKSAKNRNERSYWCKDCMSQHAKKSNTKSVVKTAPKKDIVPIKKYKTKKNIPIENIKPTVFKQPTCPVYLL